MTPPVWLGQRHRFVLRGLPAHRQRQITALWAGPTDLDALKRSQEAWLAAVEPGPD
ncbi:hypothetical protein ACGFZK_02440 [Streptomyces sp. NPDC048257]|uniref:hypothetical protein n=1 Tax=Streptomyces sp. NPDC048257 TaxID=3365526 RepID=UPI0037187C89